ncbi:MAG TPA: glycosyltransferase family 1 protein [Frankiaceae bacterium]|nr:glycosyltransferase family 1 protein [Frankiaceae bacterium]
MIDKPGPTRVLWDATSLLGSRTGVGRYTGHVLTELARMAGAAESAAGPEPQSELDLVATAYTWRGREDLPAALPLGVAAVGRRAPARLLHELWARVEIPRAAWLAGQFDVLHAPNFVLPPIGRAAGLVTVHDLGYLRVRETVSTASARYRELVPRSIRRAHLVLTPSRAIADEVIDEYGLPADRVIPTPLGVDPAWFSIEPGRPVELPDRYLLFVGTVEPRKDLPGLLAAYRLLLDAEANGPEVPPLVLVGPSGWGPALDLAGVPPERVRSLGYLEEQHLRPVLAAATALCFPSLYEGFGLPPLEALAAGTPVVASDIAAVREVVGDLAGAAPTGSVRLVPPRDPVALSGALTEVLSAPRPDPAAGRAHAAGFSWRATAERTLVAYRRALELAHS